VAELNAVGHLAEMHEGQKSQFDVIADGEIVFSKQRAGRFPDAIEVIAALPRPEAAS
jgi:predicted Rdx family selenoprotein